MKQENRIENENTIQPKKLLCPKAGTATSSPTDNTESQTDMNIVNVMLWMKRNAYEDSTIKKVAKLLGHLKKHCNPVFPRRSASTRTFQTTTIKNQVNRAHAEKAFIQIAITTR